MTKILKIDPSGGHPSLTLSDRALLAVTDTLDVTGACYEVFDFRLATPGAMEKLCARGRTVAGALQDGGALVALVHSGCICQAAKDYYVQAFALSIVIEVRYQRDEDKEIW